MWSFDLLRVIEIRHKRQNLKFPPVPTHPLGKIPRPPQGLMARIPLDLRPVNMCQQILHSQNIHIFLPSILHIEYGREGKYIFGSTLWCTTDLLTGLSSKIVRKMCIDCKTNVIRNMLGRCKECMWI